MKAGWPCRDWFKAAFHDKSERVLIVEIGERAWLRMWDESHYPDTHVADLLRRAARD